MTNPYFEVVFCPEDRLYPPAPVDINRRLVDNLDPTHQHPPSVFRLRQLTTSTTDSFSDACTICYETINADDDDEAFCCRRCTGKACRSCFKAYLETAIKDNKDPVLGCSLCRESITKNTAIRFVGHHMYRKYQYYAVSRKLGKDSKTVWCPKSECRNLLAHRGEPVRKGAKIARCRDCSTVVCVKCGIERDENHRCFCMTKTKKVQSIMCWVWKKIHSKKCPFCRIRIEQVKECRQMLCGYCNVVFCYNCREIIEYNDGHRNTTAHHCNNRCN